MRIKSEEKLLRDFLLVAPLSHALWRSVEALSFNKIDLKEPVLDVGCGFGEFAGVLYGKLECGVDINKKDLKVAISGKKYKNVIYADARKLPFGKNKFASVISVSVMEHIDGADKVIMEVGRILNKKGLFVFSVPTPLLYENLWFPKLCKHFHINPVGEYYKNLHKKAFQHITIKDDKWWEEKLKKAGFKVLLKEGTISPGLIRLHETFLLTALPSQLWRWLFGKRLIIFPRKA